MWWCRLMGKPSLRHRGIALGGRCAGGNLDPSLGATGASPGVSTSASWRWSAPADQAAAGVFRGAGWGDPGLRDRGLCGRGGASARASLGSGSPSPCRVASLTIAWKDRSALPTLTGPAEHVFDGQIEL